MPDPVAPTSVDLTQFWPTAKAITDEFDRLGGYADAAAFWAVYDAKLRDSATKLAQTRQDMEEHSGWASPGNANAASSAFYARVDAGVGSIQAWLGGTTAVRDAFAAVQNRVPTIFHTVDGHKKWLLTQDKIGPPPERIVEGDGQVTVAGQVATDVKAKLAETQRLHDELAGLFKNTVTAMNGLPTQAWQGPNAAPGAPGSPGGPGGSGSPAGGAAGTKPKDSQGQPGGAPGGAQPSTSDSGTGQTGTDSAATDSASTDPAATDQTGTDPASDLGSQPPPDPELAGLSSALTADAPTLPGSSPSPGSSTVPVGSTPPPSTAAFSPSPQSMPLPTPRRDTPGATPTGARRSTVDGIATRGAAEPGPTLARGGASGSSSSSTSGFYPPMVPPVGGGRGGGGGIQPGEGEFRGGPIRPARGADTWRAGLQPHLLGRSGEDDEPAEPPPVFGGEVLDDELWQIP